MPALVDLLNQFFFSNVLGVQARAALLRAWELASGMTWDALYVQSLDDALTEELPHLSAYLGRSTQHPTPAELKELLMIDLGETGATLLAMDTSSGTFLTELARAMQVKRLILINRHNLFTDEYRQILLNLFDHAHIRFKSVINRNGPEFSAALAMTAGYDPILIASVTRYLSREFGVLVPSYQVSPTPPSMSPEQAAELSTPPIPSTTSVTPSQETDVAPQMAEPMTPPAEEIAKPPQETAESDETETSAQASRAAMPPLPPLNTARPEPAPQPASSHTSENRLRVLIATPSDVIAERTLLTNLVRELDAEAQARFGLQLTLVNPTAADLAEVNSAVELADIFLGVIWLQFGKDSLETDSSGNEIFAGTEHDFNLALEQGTARGASWLRTVIYRSIRPPLDLLHMDVGEYTRVQQFFERAGGYAGDELVRVYSHSSELVADARARLDAWIYNYAGDLADALSEYGKSFATGGQTADALADFDQAIALYRELDRPEQELALWLQVGALQRAAGRRTDAANALDAALRLAQRLQDDNAAADALHQLGLLEVDGQQWQRALRAFQGARVYLTPDAALYRVVLADEIAAYENLGAAERAAGDLTRAGDSYRAALALAQEMDDAPRMAELWQQLGSLAEASSAWAEASHAYAEALANIDVSAAPETRRILFDAQANAHAQQGAQARARGDLADAEAAYRAALEASEQGSNDRKQRVELLATLGAIAAERGAWERSIQSYTLALAQVSALEDESLRRPLLAAQGDAYKHLGDEHFQAEQFNAASSAYRDALAIYQELDARAEEAITLYQLGILASKQERWDEANAYLSQALPLLEAPSLQETRQAAQSTQAEALIQIGREHRDAEQWAQAEIAFLQARGNLEQLGRGAETGELLTDLGEVTAAQARWQEALAYFQQALLRLTAPEQEAARMRTLRLQAGTIRQVGDLRRSAGDLAQAQAAFRQQLDLAQQLQDQELEADAFYRLGLVDADAGNWNEAISNFDQALDRLNDPAQSENHALVQRHQLVAYEKLGETERAARHFPHATTAYRSALTITQALEERDHEADLLYTLGLLAIEQENWDEALLNLRRALGIYNMMPSAPAKPQVIWNI